MLFRIRLDLLQPGRGNPKQINASLHYENADILKTRLGTFMYYHFLRDFFEDISRLYRNGDIAFCKPGIGDLCITWNVSDEEDQDSIRKKIKAGLKHTSLTEKQKYWEKYSMATTMAIVDESSNWDTDSFIISIEAKIYSTHQVVANTDLVSGI